MDTFPLPRRRLLARAALCALPGTPAAQELPLRIHSSEAEGVLTGTAEATSPHAFEQVATALATPPVWCEILMLHLNNQSCRVETQGDGPRIVLAIARKHDQAASQAQVLPLRWLLQQASAERLVVRLDAAQGPFGTTDHAVVLTAEPAPAGRTRIRLHYGCRFGSAARMLLQTYLATLGRDKVGFTPVPAGGGERLVGGLRGVVERTAMRYYLAIEAWLRTAPLAPPQRTMARLEAWFDATEDYPRQLRELDKASYLRSKRRQLGLAP